MFGTIKVFSTDSCAAVATWEGALASSPFICL